MTPETLKLSLTTHNVMGRDRAIWTFENAPKDTRRALLTLIEWYGWHVDSDLAEELQIPPSSPL